MMFIFSANYTIQYFLDKLYNQVLILDGNSEDDAHALWKICIFGEQKIRFVTDLDLIKCLEQIKYQRLLRTCASISELLSNISTLVYNLSKKYFLYKIKFVAALDLIKCLEQIRQQRLTLNCTPASELPSNISTREVKILKAGWSFIQEYICLSKVTQVTPR